MLNNNGLNIGDGLYFYRPQRSWGKVIFSQASVILSTVGGGLPSGGFACSRRGGVCLLPGGVSRSTHKGVFEGGSGLGPYPRGEIRGIRSRPTPKGEVEGYLI